jgi:hypothetical protein
LLRIDLRAALTRGMQGSQPIFHPVSHKKTGLPGASRMVTGTQVYAQSLQGELSGWTRYLPRTQRQLKGIGSVRHGGNLKNDADYRIDTKYASYDEGYKPDGAHDNWRTGQVGFRSDWVKTDGDLITLQGDYCRGKAGQLVNIPSGPSGPPPTTVIPTVDDTDDIA